MLERKRNKYGTTKLAQIDPGDEECKGGSTENNAGNKIEVNKKRKVAKERRKTKTERARAGRRLRAKERKAVHKVR